MRNRGRTSIYACLLACTAVLLVGTVGCERQAAKPAGTTKKSATPTVYTTFYPMTYFVQRIGGDHVKVVCPCPPDEDAAYWMPPADTIAKYQAADFIVINGATFEKWPQKVSLPESRVIDTAKPLHDDWIVLEGTVSHSHGPGGSHTHAGIDGHTWLDPVNAIVQARTILDALVKRYPEYKDTYEAGFAALKADLDALDARHKKVAEVVKGHYLLASHPAYNYVGRRYGWQQKWYLLDPEEMPSDEDIAKIKAFLETQPAAHILWEAEPKAEIADRFLKELGLTSVVFSPVESLDDDQRTAGADFISLMNANLDRLEAVFAK